jgi:hypothetical protein
MKRKNVNLRKEIGRFIVLPVLLALTVNIQPALAQVCGNPAGIMYGLTGTGNIHPVTIATGATGAKINPAYTGNVPDYANALGYSVLNGRFYYFKRTPLSSPQEFVTFDPAANAIIARAASPIPAGFMANMGCMNETGREYYCIDQQGKLYNYRVASNNWVTICSNIRDQFGNTLASIITNGGGPNSRIAGDIAFDGSGSLWILVSGPLNWGLYKIPANLPNANVASLTMYQMKAPTTPAPGGESIGGVGFTVTGEMLLTTTAGDNKIYRIENNLSLTYISTMTVDGVGFDFTTCNFPLFVLAEKWKKLDALTKSGNDVELNWTVCEKTSTKQYVIEYSNDGENWNELGALQSKNNQGESSYLYVHRNAESKNYYRIAQVDYDESKSYSQVKTVMRSADGQLKMSLWPNPSTESVQVEMNDCQWDANLRMLVYDQWGRQVRAVPMQKGINRIDIKKLPTGTYIVRLEEPGGRFVNRKFVKN